MNTCPRCRREYDDAIRFCPADGSPIPQLPVAVDRYLGKVLMEQFELVSLAGRGAMGTVYRATQRNMARTVAVKILREDLLEDKTAVARFLREARAAARLSHPNIVTVHLVGATEESIPFIVMEFVDGTSLDALCEREKVLQFRRAIHITRQIALALQEAHTHGIVHRDLKPENILLVDKRRASRSSTGEGGESVKVLDFGIAKIIRSDISQASAITRDGTIFGTPHYISPEQAGGREVDARADLYSLGVILFRMVTGRLPFDGASGMQVLVRHMRDTPPTPRSLAPDVPVALEDVILRVMAKDPNDRYQDAEGMIAALDEVEAGLDDDPARTILGIGIPGGSVASAVAAEASRPAQRAVMPARDKRPAREMTADLRQRLSVKEGRAAQSASVSSSAESNAADAEKEFEDTGRRIEEREGAPDEEEEESRGEGGDSGRVPAELSQPVDTGPNGDGWGRRGWRELDPGTTAQMPGGAGADDLDVPPRASRIGLWFVLGAAAIGGGAGIFFAVRAAEHPQKEAIAVARVAADLGVAAPPQFEERVVTDGPYAMHLGFSAPPREGGQAALRLALSDARGPVMGAKVDVRLRDRGGHTERVMATEWGGTYVANVGFRTAGHARLSLQVEPRAGQRIKAATDFEIATASGAPAPLAMHTADPSRSHHDRPHVKDASKIGASDGDDGEEGDDATTLPMTVIGSPPGNTSRPPPPHAIGPAPAAPPPAAPPSRAPVLAAPVAGAPQPAPHSPSAAPPPVAAPPPAPAPESPAADNSDPYRVLEGSK